MGSLARGGRRSLGPHLPPPGAAIDLVLDRPALARSQFILTEARGRPGIFWQTQKAVRTANPGARVPKGRTVEDLAIVVDTRKKYGYKFAGRSVDLQRAALPAGDYGLMGPSGLVASVERKTLENLEIPVIFAGSRKFAEEWSYRFLSSAAEDDIEVSSEGVGAGHRGGRGP